MPRGDEPLGPVANQFLFENDRLKMWHLDLQPGESSDWHVHDLDYVTVVWSLASCCGNGKTGALTSWRTPLGMSTSRGSMAPTGSPISALPVTATLWPS